MHVTANPCTPAADNLAITAGAGQDGQAQTGIIIDRSLSGYPSNGAVIVSYKATLAASKKLTLSSVSVETSDASDMSGSTSLQTFADADIAVDSGSGSTLQGCKKYHLTSLAGAKRYIRFKYTPDLNATGTDTAAISALAIFDVTTSAFA